MKGEHFFDIVKMIELDERNVAGKIVEEEKEWVPADEFLSARNALCRSLYVLCEARAKSNAR